MSIVLDRNGLEVLEPARCRELVGTVSVGRLAYVHGSIPAIVPINIGLNGDKILFRLGTGGALAAIYARQIIALEVDAIDLEAGSGWSVSVVGNPTEVPVGVTTQGEPILRSLVRVEASRLFSLGTDHIEGRQLQSSPALT